MDITRRFGRRIVGSNPAGGTLSAVAKALARQSRGGGIGRHVRFRGVWPQGRRSSSLLPGTKVLLFGRFWLLFYLLAGMV